MENTDVITQSDGTIWCNKCNLSLGSKWNKTIKQHQRSKLHKKGIVEKKKKVKQRRESSDESSEGEEEGEEAVGIEEHVKLLCITPDNVEVYILHYTIIYNIIYSVGYVI